MKALATDSQSLWRTKYEVLLKIFVSFPHLNLIEYKEIKFGVKAKVFIQHSRFPNLKTVLFCTSLCLTHLATMLLTERVSEPGSNVPPTIRSNGEGDSV